MTLSVSLDHEELSMRPGRRSGLPIMIAVHSTRLGPALGGCRFHHYEDDADAVIDVLRLAEAMSRKNAVIDVGLGGGKAVVALPSGPAAVGRARNAILLDVAERVNEFDGRYITAPDVGTSSSDMAVVAAMTPHVGGTTVVAGPMGITTRGTIISLAASIRSAVQARLDRSTLEGCRIGILGLGGVGMNVAAILTGEGAQVAGFDLDPSRRSAFEAMGGAWTDGPEALWADGDVFVPCALGGVLDDAFVAEAGVAIVCGAANNQLADPSIDAALAAAGITYVPDFVASGGGVLLAASVERRGMALADAERVVGEIGSTVDGLLADAEGTRTPLQVADGLIDERLGNPPS